MDDAITRAINHLCGFLFKDGMGPQNDFSWSSSTVRNIGVLGLIIDSFWTYPSIQWAAVKTTSGLIKEPPQKALPVENSVIRATW